MPESVEIVLNLLGMESTAGCPECGQTFQCDIRVFMMSEQDARTCFETGLHALNHPAATPHEIGTDEQGNTVEIEFAR